MIEIKDGFDDEEEILKESTADDEVLTEDEEAEAEESEEEAGEEVGEESDEASDETEVEAEESETEAPEAEADSPDESEEPVTGDVEDGTESDEGAPKSEKKSLFGKKKDKRDKKDDKIDELTDLLKRNMAEFDNFRKRTEKEKSAMYEIGARSVIEKLLPIVDNFERGLATKTDEEKEEDSFTNGMDLVYKQILKLFEDLGVEVIETEGQTFDPNFHNAVMHIDDENLGENVIAQEFQKGYTYRGTVIRHSMVQVAN